MSDPHRDTKADPEPALRQRSETVLARLHCRLEGRLLDMTADEIDSAHDQLLRAARRHLADAVGPAEAVAMGHNLTAVIEATFETSGRHREAAALYALLHDDEMLHEERRKAPVRAFVCACHRMKLAYVLAEFRRRPDDAEDRLQILLGAQDLLRRSETSTLVGATERTLLAHAIYDELAAAYRDRGDLAAAAKHWELSAETAPDQEERLDRAFEAILTQMQIGQEQAALNGLMELDDLRNQMSFEDRQALDGLRTGLEFGLGGRRKQRPRSGTADSIHSLHLASEQMLHGEETPDDRQIYQIDHIKHYVDWLSKEAQHPDEDDPLAPYTALVQGALGAMVAEKADEARRLLKEAADLEPLFPDVAPKLQRQVMSARVEAAAGDAGEATVRFEKLWPAAREHLSLDDRMAVAGYYLEALCKASKAVDDACEPLVDEVVRGLDELLSSAANAAQRKRHRETHQRSLETAVLACVSRAEEKGNETPAGQHSLHLAWHALRVGRNPELRIPPSAADPRVRALEDEFHRHLREQLAADGRFTDPRRLNALLDFELVEVAAPSRPRPLDPTLPAPEGAHVLFVFRDLLRSQPMLVLSRLEGRYSARLIPLAQQEMLTALDQWTSAVGGNEVTEADERAVVHLTSLLFGDLLDSPRSLLLFPDDMLQGVPMESLPCESEAVGRVSRRLAIQRCLRPNPRLRQEPVPFADGWLGVGDVPAMGSALPYLEQSGHEIRDVAELLGSRGIRAHTLLGDEATVAGLREQLDRHPPAVLHVAAHGVGDQRDPEACCLVLAPDPRAASGELLPFRRIRELRLQRTHLVVLSACKGTVGLSTRGTGLKGLAWAFLDAGADQVLASCYEVGDMATRRLMNELYRQLLVHPPAEALRRAREHCLDDGMLLRDAAAWSLWG